MRQILLDSTRTVDGWQVFDLDAALAWGTERAEPLFTDVAESAYYYGAVLWAAEQNITGGTGEGKFSPNAPCTRAQMATFLWRAAGSPEPKRADCPFADVSMDSYYGKAVCWAVEQGITGGTSADTFSPHATVTRAQTVTFLHRAAGSPQAADTNSFMDMAPGAYYASAVSWAVANGITNGNGANTFTPAAPCTRGQIMTFLYRYFAN